jgi:hypothetical protein
MAKWEYLRLRVSEGPPGVLSLTPHRDTNAAILKAAGFAPERIKAPGEGVQFATTVALVEHRERTYWRTVDSMTAVGWEPFKCSESPYTYEMHFRRQVA